MHPPCPRTVAKRASRHDRPSDHDAVRVLRTRPHPLRPTGVRATADRLARRAFRRPYLASISGGSGAFAQSPCLSVPTTVVLRIVVVGRGRNLSTFSRTRASALGGADLLAGRAAGSIAVVVGRPANQRL